jgi:hypothetical protein
MPLSEHEQRLLEQIERELYADDPKLASTVRSINPRTYAVRRLWRSAALFVLGLGVLVAAVVIDSGATSIALGLVGFVVMLLAALRGSSDLRRLSGRPDPEARTRLPRARGRSGRTGQSRGSFSERAQERWQRRWDDRDR